MYLPAHASSSSPIFLCDSSSFPPSLVFSSLVFSSLHLYQSLFFYFLSSLLLFHFFPPLLFSFIHFSSLAHTLYVEEINALHHRSSEKIARNLEQLLSGPRVGEESQLAHMPLLGVGVGVGAVADADQSHGKSVEGDGGRMQMQGDHHGTSAAQGEQGQGLGLEGKNAEQNALPVPAPFPAPVPALSTAFSFARITQVHPSLSQSVTYAANTLSSRRPAGLA